MALLYRVGFCELIRQRSRRFRRWESKSKGYARYRFRDPPEAWSRLEHEYRVIVHVTIWTGANVLRVPVSALFRKGDDWAVFAVADGRAQTTAIKIGNRNTRTAEVLSALAENQSVVVHPSDRIRDGVAVQQRQAQ